MRSLIVVLLFSISGQSVLANDPAETWMEGYLYLQEALITEKNGDRSGAISLMVRSLDCYRLLAREHGGFEPERRNERILLIADKLEALGGHQMMSYLPFPKAPDRIPVSGKESDAQIREAMTSPEFLTSLLATVLPENRSPRTNSFGSHLTVPLIETEETRRYDALVRKLEATLAPRYRVIPLVADGAKTR